MISKRDFLKAGAATGVSALAASAHAGPGLAQAAGPFRPSWDSFTSTYQAPDWFRDAKFGIWAHWSAQCVPEAGDWYARHMYMQGEPQYEHHLKHFGHPADLGFMEMNNRWKAEKWNPDDLLDLYRSAGARYFVALANHHDNFDNYASKYHEWNSTRVGPKRDLIGIWAKAARARGLRFGVSNHSAHAWHWFQTAYGYDPVGPRAGQRYDAWKLTKADGRGKWWDGLDPQNLYCGRNAALADGITTLAAARKWQWEHNGKWDENPPAKNPEFVKRWYLRCKDLIDSYQPDLLYFDNFDLPLGQAGLDITAYFYNSSHKRHGKLDVVVNAKNMPEARRAALVEDVERGFRSGIQPHPWQTDTCLGDWHYNRQRFIDKSYMGAAAVVHRLCDVVAKNGNLLLSVPLRGDGSIDSEERRIVKEVGGWTSRFGEAIYGTRPWGVFGEGPTEVESGQFGEGKVKPFTAADIRFTTKRGALYAMTLGRPQSGTVLIRSLAGRPVDRVEVVGAAAPLRFQSRPGGIEISLPDSASHAFGVALKIMGPGLVG
ncbi:alpha-L-fucosidase [Sphingomonas sp.]|uniref:alpha-L-fucosidase n=1 Tax=Sphingomonas sp. TaxID=28214 RepID=UPI0031E30D1D